MIRRICLAALFMLMGGAASHAACSNTTIGTITCIQSNSDGNGGTSTTQSVVMGSTLGAGHLYSIFVMWCANTACNAVPTTTMTLSDNGCSETYNILSGSTHTFADNIRVAAFDVFNSKGGCTTITANRGGDATGFLSIVLTELNGSATFATTQSYDVGGNGSSASCSTCSITSSTTNHPNEFIIATFNAGVLGQTPTAPAVSINAAVGGHSSLAATFGNTVSSTGTQTVTWTQSTSHIDGVIATFNLTAPVMVPRKKMGPF